MEEEKTLLQQIREKEQEFTRKIESVRTETDAAVAAARSEAEDLLCTADSAAKTAAEELYWKEKGRTELEIEELKRATEAESRRTSERGYRNLPGAVQKITGYVTLK